MKSFVIRISILTSLWFNVAAFSRASSFKNLHPPGAKFSLHWARRVCIPNPNSSLRMMKMSMRARLVKGFHLLDRIWFDVFPPYEHNLIYFRLISQPASKILTSTDGYERAHQYHEFIRPNGEAIYSLPDIIWVWSWRQIEWKAEGWGGGCYCYQLNWFRIYASTLQNCPKRNSGRPFP